MQGKRQDPPVIIHTHCRIDFGSELLHWFSSARRNKRIMVLNTTTWKPSVLGRCIVYNVIDVMEGTWFSDVRREWPELRLSLNNLIPLYLFSQSPNIVVLVPKVPW